MQDRTQGFSEITRASRDMRWPGGHRIALVFTLAYEMWSPGVASGVGPMGNVLPGGVFDPNADSYGRYNATAGIHRLLRIADRAGVAASIMTSGRIAEYAPDHLKDIAAAGHEIVGHAYAQDLIAPTLSPEAEIESIRRSTDLIEKAAGARPEGWISPRVTAGERTLRQLTAHGYRWHGDAVDDDLPYLQRFPEGEIVAVPVTVDFNDLPHAMRFGRTPRQFVEMFDDTVTALRRTGGDTVILDVLVHGHCYGRPAGAWAFEEIVRRCTEQDDLWITTRGPIADHFRSETGA